MGYQKLNIQSEPRIVEKCIEETGIGFMFAPLFHPAMKYVMNARKETGVRTVFNILGPMTNPAGAKSQVIGVFNPALMRDIANVMKNLGSRHVMVVNGDGLDEITIAGKTKVVELKGSKIRVHDINPEDYGFNISPLNEILGGDAQENAKTIINILKGEIELDEAYFGGKRKGNRGRGSKNKVIVFGILERKGKVSVNIVPDVSAESLLHLTVKKVRRGSIVYTDKWKSYDSLMFCGYKHLKVDHSKTFTTGKVYINGMEGFWSYAKERLIKFHGVSTRKFLYYIKEQEWRYNNRDKDLFELIVDYMLGAVKL